jgi:hypothetical protein
MFRRNLRRLIPIGPRDVDRPEQYGKNDDTQPNSNTHSGPLGSRPRARNSEPYLMPNPIPKPSFHLEKSHYLTLYDAFARIDPTLEVKAFISDKSAYSFDMLVLMDRHNANNEYIGWLNQELKNYIANNATSKEAKLKALVQFFDKRELHVGYGVKGATPDALNLEPDWDQRELIRSSLNYDWTKWETGWTHWFREVVDHLCAWSEYAIDAPDLKIHRHYWAAQTYWARKRVQCDGTELFHFVCDNYMVTMSDAMPHPVLRFEDLHTTHAASVLREIVKTQENIFIMRQDSSMLSEEEMEYLRKANEKTVIDYNTRLQEKKKLEEEIKTGKKKEGWIFYKY